MRRIVAVEYLSLDGVTQDPGPAGEYEHRGWTAPYWNDEIAMWQTDQLFASEALLLGTDHLRGVRRLLAVAIR